MTALSLEGITKFYGDMAVLRGLDQHIPDGTFFTLLGPSGCGKTTLLRIVAGFVEPTSGIVRFGSEDITRLPPYKRQVGMVFQDYALFPHMTAFDNVAYGLRARRFSRSEIARKTQEYLERVGLAGLEDRLPAEMSGGQMQRVALARALVVEPQVLLMDEPLSNLDASLRIQMRDVIRNLQLETGTTTIFVTHDQEEALVLSDRVAVMKDGLIDQCASPLEVYRKPATAYVANFVGAANLLPARWSPHTVNGAPTLDLLGHKISLKSTEGFGPNQGLLVVRPENLKIRPAGQESPDNALPGKVESVRFHGERTSYVVRVTDGTTVAVSVSGATHAQFFAIGDHVNLALEEDIWFVAGEEQ